MDTGVYSGSRADSIVGVATSRAQDPASAVAEAVAQLDVTRICFVLAFVPDHLVGDELACELEAALPAKPVFGCTTAGQITPEGYESDTLLLIAFPKDHFRCASTLISPLRPVSIEATASEARRLSTRFQRTGQWSRIALTFADGLSKQEDVLVAALEAGLEDIPVFGGSAGRGLEFSETFVLHGGRFHSDAALLILIETNLKFAGLGFDHFLPTDKQMVVTRAVPEERVVLEINGGPAAQEYARLVGCGVEDLCPEIFAENPVLVRNHNAWHVRAIQKVEPDGGLAFLSAIDDGLLLTLGQGTEIFRTLDDGLSLNHYQAGTPSFILGFDCYLRKLEIEQKGLIPKASASLREHGVLGFNTFGEQHFGVHVNQTFVGVAFFPPPEARRLD